MITRPMARMLGDYFSLRSTDDIPDAINSNEEIKVVCTKKDSKYYGQFTIVTLEQLKDPNKMLPYEDFFKSHIPNAPKYQLFNFKFIKGESGKPNTLAEKLAGEEEFRKLYDEEQERKNAPKPTQQKLPI